MEEEKAAEGQEDAPQRQGVAGRCGAPGVRGEPLGGSLEVRGELPWGGRSFRSSDPEGGAYLPECASVPSSNKSINWDD